VTQVPNGDNPWNEPALSLLAGFLNTPTQARKLLLPLVIAFDPSRVADHHRPRTPPTHPIYTLQRRGDTRRVRGASYRAIERRSIRFMDKRRLRAGAVMQLFTSAVFILNSNYRAFQLDRVKQSGLNGFVDRRARSNRSFIGLGKTGSFPSPN
jgi:hypothetical protein